MPFQIYEQTRAVTEEEEVGITPVGVIVFSPMVNEKYLKHVDYIQVFFDPETKRVGVKPAEKDDDFTFKLIRPPKSRRAFFSGRGILRKYNIAVDGDRFKPVRFRTSFEDGMITFKVG
jgi:hypothetical protein